MRSLDGAADVALALPEARPNFSSNIVRCAITRGSVPSPNKLLLTIDDRLQTLARLRKAAPERNMVDLGAGVLRRIRLPLP
jgi:hypothetical protein